VSGAQLLARVQAAAFVTQPFAVDEVSAGERRANPRAPEPLDRLAIQRVGGLAVGQQRPRAGLDP